jgi:hypothetical protein
MIAASPATRIFLAITPIDIRKGFDGLYGLVSNHLEKIPAQATSLSSPITGARG